MLRELVRAVIYCVFALGGAYLLASLVELIPVGGPAKPFVIQAIWVTATCICALVVGNALLELVP